MAKVLDRSAQRLSFGGHGPADIDKLDAAEPRARQRAHQAIDEAMHDDWFIPQSKYDHRPPDGRYSTSLNARVVTALDAYSTEVRERLLSDPQLDGNDLQRGLEDRKRHATDMRGEMSQEIERRVRGVLQHEEPGRAEPSS
ncbi:hypothetical protein [Streptomyces sp. NPDC059916]|uniref:hypothetical protein n=1 Tax=Streptomyces sp. NPDC059916 TaxID=3347001 RepID=UPI0036BA3927